TSGPGELSGPGSALDTDAPSRRPDLRPGRPARTEHVGRVATETKAPKAGRMAMPYPKQLYTRDDGEVSAGFRPAGTEPDLGEAGQDAIHYLATTVTTRGEFGLYRVEMRPRAGGPKTHFHRS